MVKASEEFLHWLRELSDDTYGNQYIHYDLSYDCGLSPTGQDLWRTWKAAIKYKEEENV